MEPFSSAGAELPSLPTWADGHGMSEPRTSGAGRDLCAAIASEELSLQFQPIVDMHTFRVHSLEALSRWHIPDVGWYSPSEWIPLAEASGLIVPFGDWMIPHALDMLAALRKRSHTAVRLAINLSPRQIADPAFLESFLGRLQDHSLCAGALEIELTEDHFRIGADQLREPLSLLRGMGCSVALDDFGTGDSSLASLVSLPIDTLKIDRAFVRGLPADRHSAAIVDSTVMMAHRLGLAVVAEGIETIEQFDFLRQVGCDFAQGFLISRPLVPEDVFERLADWDSRVAHLASRSVESSVTPWHTVVEAGGVLAGLSVLIVDDEADVLAIAEAVLQGAGARVQATTSIAEALGRLNAGPVDVMLFDVHMPGLNGWDFMQLVRHEVPGIPLIAVTGYVDERLRAIHRPAAIVQKPYRAAQLIEVVRSVVRRSVAA
jgi:EAL domain-containing protein (putative c-di-GMP-specific phosphodiesterase class I)